ncbi:putative membrane protein [Crossiella equi]|uniref:Membrane protein n=1 Tax=Crossiella equi TaxID=130796 RepID=A0ABS5AK84_9PSEU|nr:DUF3515 domain-containing protein [Crossiella equi]MBP2476978.1 putative membrane protein [Crossiella equi]
MAQNDRSLPRPVLIALIALPLLLVAAVGTLGVLYGSTPTAASTTTAAPRFTGPVALPPIPAEKADSPACAKLVGGLPAQLTSAGEQIGRREVVQPQPAGTAVWGNEKREPVVLRCGLSRPDELTPTSRLSDISGVQWLELRGEGASSWVAVDREVYVVLTVPEGAGTGPLQGVSEAILPVLPQQKIDTGTAPK